jgi:hypothetical protein
MNYPFAFWFLPICVVTSPAALLVLIGLPSLFGRPLSERLTARLTQFAVVTGLLAAIGILALMLIDGTRRVTTDLGGDSPRTLSFQG